MKNFSCTISVIIPVYNSEEYLNGCFNSLLFQTLPSSSFEVIMVDDGSSDAGRTICADFSARYDNFKLFVKENGGSASARNFGIDRARGKYITFLDADDSLSFETLENICNFFDAHYDEIDEVTYPIKRYFEGRMLPLHYRYRFLKETGVYDLNEYPYISQTNINICVKNTEKKIYFDSSGNFRHEDQQFSNEHLMAKMKIGYVAEAEYKYNRNNETSIINKYMYPYYIFESTINYYEALFARFKEKVPRYFQGLFINDIEWKLCQDKLYPFHYDKEAFEQAEGRIKALLSRCDTEMIMSYPHMNSFHGQYWLNMKPNVSPTIITDRNFCRIMAGGKLVYIKRGFEIIIHKLRVNGGQLRLLAFVKSPLYNCTDDPCEVYAVENGTRRRKLETFLSVHSYNLNNFVRTNRFHAFDYRCNAAGLRSLSFEVDFKGYTYPTEFWCMPTAVFGRKGGLNSYIRENTLITLDGSRILFETVSEAEADEIEAEANESFKEDRYVYELRRGSLIYRKSHKIWLYYDYYTVDRDNGYYQFINDFEHNEEDGIERYYIFFNKNVKEAAPEKYRLYFVEFGSEFHKLLYLSAERIFTAYYGLSTTSPFRNDAQEAKYADILKFKTIYLQHGVLHAALHTRNSVERCRAEQIVVSSGFELNNYMKNYGYPKEDLIPTGMARYDIIDRTKPAKGKILYAPTWRNYLTYTKKPSVWITEEEKLKDSDYFKGICELINSERLISLLEEYDLDFEVKLHPIFADAAGHLIKSSSARVKIASKEPELSDYNLFITDFSSYLFDFISLKRPMIYFVTDYEQFRSGMHHYKELDLDFKEGFGPLALTADQCIEAVGAYIRRGYKVPEPYKSRMENFFIPLENCRENLYRYVIKEDEKSQRQASEALEEVMAARAKEEKAAAEAAEEQARKAAEAKAKKEAEAEAEAAAKAEAERIAAEKEAETRAQYPFLLSVIVPVYNAAPYLNEMAESILSQDLSGIEAYAKGIYELIFVDDGSDDGSGQIIDEYAADYDNIKAIHKEHGGKSSARNAGIDAAEGRYLTFPDPDSKLSKSVFKDCLSFMLRHDGEVSMAGYPVRFFGEQSTNHWTHFRFKDGSGVIDLVKYWARIPYFASSAFFKAGDIKGRISFGPDTACGDEVKFVYQVIFSGTTKIGLVDTCSYYSRRYTSSSPLLAECEIFEDDGERMAYVKDVLLWLLDASKKAYGSVRKFVQYAVMGQLQWFLNRTDRGEDGKKLLGEEGYKEYKELIFSVLEDIGSDIIIAQQHIWSEHMYYIFSRRTGKKPAPEKKDGNVYFRFGKALLPSGLADIYTHLDFLEINNGILHIEGYSMNYDPEAGLAIYVNDEQISFEPVKRDADKYCFDDAVMFSEAFCADIPLDAETGEYKVRFCSTLGGTEVTKKPMRFSKNMPLAQTHSKSYFIRDNWIIRREDSVIAVRYFSGEAAAETDFEGEFEAQLGSSKDRAEIADVISLRKQALRIISGKDPEKKIWLVMDRLNEANDNGEAMFRYLSRINDPDIEAYFVIDKESADFERMKEFGHVFAFGSRQHLLLALTCDYIVSSSGDEHAFNPWYQNYKKCEVIRDLLAEPKFIFLQHGIIKDDLSGWLNRFNKHITGFVCTAPREAQSVLDGGYYFKPENVWLTGLPRHDRLYNDEKNYITVMPTWRRWLAKEKLTNKPGDDFDRSEYFAFYNALLNDDRLLEAADEYGYTLCFMPHPSVQLVIDTFSRDERVKFFAAEKPYNEIFAESSLVITDYSSTSMDFSLLGKPVVYCQFDREKFCSDHMYTPGYFDYEADGFGEVTYDMESLIDVIIGYMKDGCRLKDVYRERAEKFFIYHDKCSCERVYNKIKELK